MRRDSLGFKPLPVMSHSSLTIPITQVPFASIIIDYLITTRYFIKISPLTEFVLSVLNRSAPVWLPKNK